MFYTFYMGSQYDFSEFKKILIEMVNTATGNSKIVNDDINELEIDNEWFNASLREDSKGIKFIGEDYELDLKFLIWIEVYYSQDGISEQMMMKFIGAILSKCEGESILLSNGDKPILQRKKDIVIVDDSRLDTNEEFPFKLMEIEYTKGLLKQV